MSTVVRRVVAVVLAVVVLGAGSWALGAWQPFAYDWPDEWDPRVAKLADYVERHADFDFEHPVRTRFLGDKEFEKLVTNDEDDLTDDDRDFYEATGRLLRSLGLASGEVDLFKDQNTLNASGILAYYSPSDREMVIRMNPDDATGNELSPALRATVVHELAHALQDQRFGLARMRERAHDSGHDEALTTLIEGHALSIENMYVSDNFSDAEREQYDDATQGDDEDVAAIAKVPEILSAQQFSPYVFGPTFVEALERKGEQTLLDAFMKKQPKSLEQTILPSKYFEGDKPEEIDIPKGPKNSEPAVSGQLSQLDLFFLMVRAWDAPEALRLSDLWGNGSYAGFEVGDDDFCAVLNVRGENDETTDELRQAFDEWAKSPGLRDAKVTSHDHYVSVESCDPGPKVDLDLPSESDTRQLFWRAGDISYIWRSEPDSNAECVATGIYTEFTIDELQSDERAIDRYNELIAECRRD
jgi:hypothetical protein